MSSYDAPGYGTAQTDQLKVGVWGEHQDGSLIFVASTENHTVIFEIFDFTSGRVIEYRDALSETAFRHKFSWSSPNKIIKDAPWSWHDKTPFPWDRVIAGGAASGTRLASADDVLAHAEAIRASRQRLVQDGDTVTINQSAAQQVADNLGAQGRELLQRDFDSIMRRHLRRPLRQLGREISQLLDRHFGNKS